MAEPRGLHCAARVGRSYDEVRDLLHRQPLKLLQRATGPGDAHSSTSVATLRLDVAGVEIDVPVRIHVRRVRDLSSPPSGAPTTCVELSWGGASVPALFPAMLAELFAQPLSPSETQLEIVGSYWLPLGPVGNAIDDSVGHRVAESSVRRLLTELVAQIQSELPEVPRESGLA